ncbi:MAG: flavodoxin-dependent (E)-4-hydroxy-3-methylbut-2-enyl-diphosphate synthase, partial [Desulfomonilia bacterium]
MAAHRDNTQRIYVGPVPVGGGAPVTIQSMTNTLTRDAEMTVAQIRALEKAGCDIVRVSVPDEESAQAFREIK